MPKFAFKLEAVLRQRQAVEDERHRAFGVAQTAMAAMESELRRLDEAARGVSDDVRGNHLTGRLDMAYLAAHRRYVLATQRIAVQLAERMAAQQVVVDEARRKVAEAVKERKVIEKLRERQQQRWADAVKAREAGALAEVNMQIALDDYFGEREGELA